MTNNYPKGWWAHAGGGWSLNGYKPFFGGSDVGHGGGGRTGGRPFGRAAHQGAARDGELGRRAKQRGILCKYK